MTTLLIPLVKIECKDQFILKFGNDFELRFSRKVDWFYQFC